MNRFLKKILSLSMVVTLTACTVQNSSTKVTGTNSSEDDFIQFIDQYVAEIASSDYTTMHQYFEHPEDYGIEVSTVEVSLGEFETSEDTIQGLKENLDELYTYDRSSLNNTLQDIYDELEYELTLAIDSADEKYDYTTSVWGSLSGIHEALITFFSEYTLRSQQDIDDLIILINDVPRYIDEALEYTKKQAENDSLCFDYETVIENIQEIADSKDDSSVTKGIYKEIDSLNLDEATTKAYKEKVKYALDTSFFPTYQTMAETLSTLKDEVLPLTGLANLPNGKSYYELLVKDATGSSESIEEIRKNLENAVDSALSGLQSISRSNYSAYLNMNSVTTGYSDIEDILKDLSVSYKKDFPEVEEMDYDLSALSDDQSTDGIVAYFMIPAIDNTDTYRIRYNKRDYGREPDSLDLFTTLAHEGIAGHMYQAQYNKENLDYTIQYLFKNDGFTEGWATYAEMNSYNYINFDSDTVQLNKLNEILTDMYVGLMDISIHYDGLTLNEFTDEYGDLFGTDLEDLYNQLADNPTSFLSYYYGYLQIMQLRNEAKKELGKDFNNTEFNEAILQSGSVNFDIVKDNIEEYINNK